MVEVVYLDDTKDTYETPRHCLRHWRYKKMSQCFQIPDIDGEVIIPREFVKSIRHIKINK